MSAVQEELGNGGPENGENDDEDNAYWGDETSYNGDDSEWEDIEDEDFEDDKDKSWLPSSSEYLSSDESDSCSEVDDDIVLVPACMQNITVVASDEECPSDDDTNESDDDQHSESAANIPLLVYKNSLFDLAHLTPPSECENCGAGVTMSEKVRGSGLTLLWKCTNGHECKTWCSQPKLRGGVWLGDLEIASSTVLSGNNFIKIKQFFDFMKIPIVSKRSFYRFQGKYILPTIESEWQRVLNTNLEQAKGEGIIVDADGRNDTPGFCAKYCTYVAMRDDTKDIVWIEIIDKRETALKSPNMEKEGLIRTLKALEKAGVVVKELVTDAHSGIIKYMREEHPDKKHSNDVWHAAKNLAKRLTKAASKADFRDINPWIRDIVTHFWFCCQVSETYEQFVARWKGILYHVSGKHEWVLGEGVVNKCEHNALYEEDESKPKLSPYGKAHRQLRSVLWQEKFLKTIPSLLTFRSTAVIENFNDLILMYASKRIAFSYPAYRARNFLAALDYTYHKNRREMRNKKGEVMWQRKYNKNSKRWTVHARKEDKKYEYIPRMMKDIVDAHNSKKSFTPSYVDPKVISPTIAPLPPPPTKTIVATQIFRFSTEKGNNATNSASAN